MKILVISDVHANIVALEAVWRAESDADRIVCAGDLVDYGPRPVECIEWMIEKDVEAVVGNHDLGVIRAYEKPDADAPFAWRRHNAQRLAAHHVEYLRRLPVRRVLDIDGCRYGLVHAYLAYEIIRSVEAFREFSRERFGRELDRIIFGHTHRRELHYLADDLFWLNPGSVSYRRDDEHFRGAHYAVIQDGRISLRSMPYPADILFQEAESSGVCEQDLAPTRRWWAPT